MTTHDTRRVAEGLRADLRTAERKLTQLRARRLRIWRTLEKSMTHPAIAKLYGVKTSTVSVALMRARGR